MFFIFANNADSDKLLLLVFIVYQSTCLQESRIKGLINILFSHLDKIFHPKHL